MKDLKKKTWKGLAKKELVFCTFGVMMLGMAACGGRNKKTDVDSENF